MKTLILGGTQFLGRQITQACLDDGHEVTLFYVNLTPTPIRRLLPSKGGGPNSVINRMIASFSV